MLMNLSFNKHFDEFFENLEIFYLRHLLMGALKMNRNLFQLRFDRFKNSLLCFAKLQLYKKIIDIQSV